MKSVKPIVLLSFLFFASVIADDFSEPVANFESSNEIEDFDDSDEFDFGADMDFGNEDEDIVNTEGARVLPSSPNLIKAPAAPSTVPVCKKYKCKMNGNNLVWDPLLFAPSNCKQNYEKLANVLKFRCQAFCVKECDNS